MAELARNARSFLVPWLSSDQVIRIRSVASVPAGAPLAMSNDGKIEVRAPAMPSMVSRACAGSNCPMPPSPVTTARGRSKVEPPLKDRAWKNTPCRVRMSVPTQIT